MKRYCCHVLDKRAASVRARHLRDPTTMTFSEERMAILHSIRQSELSKYGWKVDMWESSTSQRSWDRFALPSAMSHTFRCEQPGCADTVPAFLMKRLGQQW